MKTGQIPILGPDDFGRKLFFGNSDVKDFTNPVNKFFHINRIEDHVDLIKTPMPPHRKSVYVFIFFKKGLCVRSKGLDTYTLTDDTFFFLPPYQITSRKMQNLDSEGYFCHFDPEIFNKNFYQREILAQFPFLSFFGDPTVKINPQSLDPIINILERLETEYLCDKRLDLDFVSAYLLALFREINLHVHIPPKHIENSALRITESYKNALIQNIYEKQKVADYASLLSVTPDYLNRCVKTITGKTSHQLLDDMLLLEAKILLNQTSLNVSEVAFKIGKENISDFVRFFKSKTGVTPKEYKQKSDLVKL